MKRSMASAGAVVAEAVTEGLKGTTFGIVNAYGLRFPNGELGDPAAFLNSLQPPDLLGWIYYEFAAEIVASRPLRRCEGCGAVFVVTDERQRYHDRKCSQRARYHRAAGKRRQSQ